MEFEDLKPRMIIKPFYILDLYEDASGGPIKILNLEEIKPGMLIKTAVPNRIFDKEFGYSKWFWSNHNKILIILGSPIKESKNDYFSIKVLYDGKIGYILWSTNGETNLIYEI